MSQSKTGRVLIAGAGPAGLVAALILLKNGISVRIIEKEREHHIALRGAGVQPRTLELEHFMGVNEVRETGKSLHMTLHMMDPKDPHRIMNEQPFLETVEPTASMPITRAVMLGQFQHQAILRKHIESFGTSVELGTELVAFEDTVGGVQATLRKTIDGTTSDESAVFEYLIGADGARSFVRKSLGVQFDGHREEGMVAYLVDAFVEGHDLPGVTMFGKPGSEFVSFIQSAVSGLYQIVMSNELRNYDMLLTSDNKDLVQQEIRRISKRNDICLTEIRSQSQWRANVRMASSFQKGRVFIVGDAAHTHTPAGGQGLNTSIQDSYNLAWKLALVLKGISKSIILDSYSSERMPVVSQMLNLTTAIMKESRKANQEPPKAGDKPMRGRELLQLNVNYRWSDIIFDERFAGEEVEKNGYGVEGQAVRAGDRAPDAPSLKCLYAKDGLEEVSRLFDLFNPIQHVALVFHDALSDTATHLSPMARFPKELLLKALIIPAGAEYEPSISSGFDYVFRDTEGHAFNGYGLDATASTPSAVIIRPDAHVGAFATSSAGVEKYTTLILI